MRDRACFFLQQYRESSFGGSIFGGTGIGGLVCVFLTSRCRAYKLKYQAKSELKKGFNVNVEEALRIVFTRATGAIPRNSRAGEGA